MTRPETLVRQLTNAVLNPLLAQQRELGRRNFPPPPLTNRVRYLWREYQKANRISAGLKKQLERAGAMTYGNRARMKDTGEARAKIGTVLAGKVKHAGELRDAAMLAVLGLDAAKARPIVLKLKADLERLAK